MFPIFPADSDVRLIGSEDDSCGRCELAWGRSVWRVVPNQQGAAPRPPCRRALVYGGRVFSSGTAIAVVRAREWPSLLGKHTAKRSIVVTALPAAAAVCVHVCVSVCVCVRGGGGVGPATLVRQVGRQPCRRRRRALRARRASRSLFGMSCLLLGFCLCPWCLSCLVCFCFCFCPAPRSCMLVPLSRALRGGYEIRGPQQLG